MSTTQPIKKKENLKKFKEYYKNVEGNPRNYTIIVMGLNTALRINDILHLTYDMIYTKNQVNDYITVKEQKTGKQNRVFLNKEVKNTLLMYRKFLINSKMYRQGNSFLFPSPRKNNAPLSRFQAYRMICKAAKASDLQEHISCHSLRKTFGYHAWKQGNDPIVIMLIFNHSSFHITKRYLCIDQDEKDKVYKNLII